MRVVGLFVHPVRSLAGVPVESIGFGPSGTIVGDGAWALQDAYGGAVLSCQREPRLLFVGTSVADGEVLVHVPGVDEPTPVAGCGDVVSSWLGKRVRPLPLAGASSTPGYAHVVTTGTVGVVASLCAGLGDASSGAAAIRRVRPHVLVDDEEPYGEVRWGRSALVGPRARLQLAEPTRPCATVEHPQPGMPAVPGLLNRLRESRSTGLGCYVTGSSGDRLRVGEALTVSP